MAVARPGASQQATSSELEWQFDALDLAAVDRWLELECRRSDPVVAGMTLRRAPAARRLTDTYFDTADWRIGRGGYVLRERHQRGRVESTMKSLVDAEDGFRRRVEVSEPGPVAELQPDGAGEVAWRLRVLAGRAPLLAVVQVVTRRRPIELVVEGTSIGELVLDETTIGVPGTRRRLHLRRVELEVSGGALSQAKRIADAMRAACALSPATLSKFEAGLLAAGLSIPGPPDLGSTHVDQASTIGELALAAARRDAQAMLAHEPGTRLGEDVEELHQMRVATRRLRAAFAQFEEVLPVRATALRAEIGWIASALGAVRDLDVQLEQTAEWIAEADAIDRPYLEELTARLDAERSSARHALLEALDSRRYSRLVAGLTTMLRTSAGRRNTLARSPAVVAMPALVAARHRAATKAARRARRTGIPAEFHRLRIRTKQLRYALEFAADLYGTTGRRYVKLLANLQGRLGSMQDAEVAAERLRSVALELPREEQGLSIAAVFTVGGLAARYRSESVRLLARLAGELDVLSGGAWRRLLSVMERERAAALAAREARLRRPSLEVAVLPAPDGVAPEVEAPEHTEEGGGTVRLATGADRRWPARAVIERAHPTTSAIAPLQPPMS